MLGGAEEIGANSCYLNIDGTGIFIDAGIHPRDRTEKAFPAVEMIGDRETDVLMITHAHADHLGELPYIMRRFPSVELAIVGKNAMKFRKEVDKIFFPNKVICGTTGSSTLPLLENRQPNGEGTQLFVCQNKTCRMPVDNVSDALRFLKVIKEEMVL